MSTTPAVETTPEVAKLVEDIGMTAHPEGGFYKETYRSSVTVGWRVGVLRGRAAGTHV